MSDVVSEMVRSAVDDRIASGAGADGVGDPAVAYLAHPFAKKDLVEVQYQPKLEALGVSIINPFQRKEQAGYEQAIASTGLTAEMCADIVRMDLEKIDSAGAVIALLIDDNMIGTIMEIFYAAKKGYPVFTYTPRDRERKHPWIRHLTIVCPTEEALAVNLRTWINGRRDQS